MLTVVWFLFLFFRGGGCFVDFLVDFLFACFALFVLRGGWPAITRLGHERQDLLSLRTGMRGCTD